MPTITQILSAVADAIGHQEGFYAPGNQIPAKLHNPGDLRAWMDSTGTPYESLNGFVNFPVCRSTNCTDPDHPCETGWHALKVQLWTCLVKRNLTLQELFAGKPGVYPGFAPAKDKNDPLSYAQKVLARITQKLALPDTVTINTVLLTLASDAQAPALASKPPLTSRVLPAQRPEAA